MLVTNVDCNATFGNPLLYLIARGVFMRDSDNCGGHGCACALSVAQVRLHLQPLCRVALPAVNLAVIAPPLCESSVSLRVTVMPYLRQSSTSWQCVCCAHYHILFAARVSCRLPTISGTTGAVGQVIYGRCAHATLATQLHRTSSCVTLQHHTSRQRAYGKAFANTARFRHSTPRRLALILCQECAQCSLCCRRTHTQL